MPFRAELAVVAVALLGVGACADGGASDGDYHDDGRLEQLGSVAMPLVASDPVSAVVAAGCATEPLLPLGTQLVEEIDCLSPGALVAFKPVLGDRISAGASVFPFLQSYAVESLKRVIDARGTTLQLNSGLRTLPQQFVLYRYYQEGRCDITLAALPGTSNHESGLAVDVQDNAGWRSYFAAEGWKWQGASDPVHYDIAGGVDMRGLSTRAFQRLWNRNHPEDMIEEDGDYGADTEARLTSAPIGGFPVGAVCDSDPGPSAGGSGAGGTGGAAGSSAGGNEAGQGGAPSSAGATSGATFAGSASAGAPASAGSGAAGVPVAGAATLGAAEARDSAGCSVARGAPALKSSWWLLVTLSVLWRWRSRLSRTGVPAS